MKTTYYVTNLMVKEKKRTLFLSPEPTNLNSRSQSTDTLTFQFNMDGQVQIDFVRIENES